LWTVARLALLLLAACGETDGDPIVAPSPPEPAGFRAVTALATLPHDAGAFTEGLLIQGGTLYESTGLRGQSSVRIVDLTTGTVRQRVTLPVPYFGEGIAAQGGRLYQLTWEENTAFVYDLSTLGQVGNVSYGGEGWGLTSDGTSLIRSDGSNNLQFLDPATFQVRKTLAVFDGTVPVHRLNELEWVNGEIWANVWQYDVIARIDPTTGLVKQWLDLTALNPPIRHTNPEAVANGIAYDAVTGKVYVTGKLWPVMYEIAHP
jgi:glutaminyl-peptide cyclotransferase